MYEEALKSKKLAEESKAVPGSGGSSLSGKGKRYGKGKGRGTQPEEEEAEDEERVADERAAFSMEEDEERRRLHDPTGRTERGDQLRLVVVPQVNEGR